uniref:Uncharacterized protein n=1 Tax=Candidatus Kentrum sp. LPFa TaxID=2126335 RepID=A0A450WBH6_9GAMM|nr:MAG: hypothetical protein BECKLPF1236B_GA0070989_10618 [Candidatus Kentron sp. LPFa]
MKESLKIFWKRIARYTISILAILFIILIVAFPITETKIFSENSDKISHLGVLITFLSLVIAVAIAVIEGLQSRELKDQIDLLQKTSKNIEDITRRPLTSIIDIISVCCDLLGKAQRTGGKIWFVGLTMAFGYPHNIPHIHKKWKKAGNEKPFDKACEEFNNLLTAILGGNLTDKFLVTLSEENIDNFFLKPLYEKPEYKEHKENIEKGEGIDFIFEKKTELINHHEKIIEKGGKINYVDRIPLQMLAVQLEENKDGKVDHPKIGCVVFHVGTENIRSANKAIGFYTELPNICDMFTDFAESISKNYTED